jgi:BspA type Leucine rich repeat region (6 copies)
MPENNKRQKKKNLRGPYQHFDGPTKLMRKSEIHEYATRYLDNIANNKNGKCDYGFMKKLVQEAFSKNDTLQITRDDIRDEAARIVAKQRKVSPESSSGTPKASTTIDEPLDADDPPGDVLQVSVGIDVLAREVANPQPPPLLAGGVKVNEADAHAAANPPPLPLAAGVEVNEAAVVAMGDYFLFRSGVIVPRTVTHVRIHHSVEFYRYLASQQGAIPDRAFNECTTLVHVVLDYGIKSIGAWAFNGCKSLLLIIIPPSVTDIYWYAFAGCTGLRRIIIPPTVTCMLQGAFELCTTLVEVVLHEGLDNIGEKVFCGCSSLLRIIIPLSVTEIRASAFAGCTALEEIILPEGLQTIYESAFAQCSSLLRINIPRRVEYIGNKAFESCTSLVEVVLHDCLLKTIASRAFSQCSSLLRIDIPESVSYIGLGAFDGCGVTILVGPYDHKKNAYTNVFHRGPGPMYYPRV